MNYSVMNNSIPKHHGIDAKKSGCIGNFTVLITLNESLHRMESRQIILETADWNKTTPELVPRQYESVDPEVGEGLQNWAIRATSAPHHSQCFR